jgi:TrpR-related protein YerC/YecD
VKVVITVFSSRLKSEQVDRLAQAFLCLETEEDCYRLFEDLFTIREIQDLSSRMEIALMLRDKVTYNEIVEKTGASTATIGRVNRALNYGAGGYERIINRIDIKD